MPIKVYQNNFVGGVISPSLFARSDLAMYYRSAAIADNFVVSKEGSLRKRRGVSSFVELQGIDWEMTTVVPYRYDRTQGCVILVYLSGGKVMARTYSKNSWSAGPSGKEQTIDSPTTMTPEDIKNLQSTQIGDNVYLSNGKKSVILRMLRQGNGDCVIESVKPWERAEKPAPALSCSAIWEGEPSPGVVISSHKDIYYAAYVVSGGVKSDRKRSGAVRTPIPWFAGGSVSITVKVKDRDFDYVVLGKQAGSLYGELVRWYPEDFKESASGDITASFTDDNISPGEPIYQQTDILGDQWGNDPLCTNAFQQRLVFANATIGDSRYPMTLWFSEVGNINNFHADRPATDADPFSPTIFSSGPAFIRFLSTFQEMLLLFTDCGLFSISFSQQSGFGANSCRISKFSDIACSPRIKPITTSAGVVFVASDEKTLYTVNFDIQDNAMKPVNQSVLVEHITRKNRITSIALAEYPQNVIWVSLENGTMASFTFERDQEVFAWSTHSIPGNSVNSVISLGTVSEGIEERTHTDMIFCIERNGRVFLCTGEYQFTDEIGGESNPVRGTLVTLRPETQDHSISSRPKNIKDVIMSVYHTGSLSVEAENGGLDPVLDQRDGEFTGEVKIMPHGHINENGQIRIVSPDGNPCEILAVKQVMEL